MIKNCIGLFPKRFREHLKRNPKLTAFYTKSLHNAGILQRIPTEKEQAKLYTRNIIRQQCLIESYLPSDIEAPVLVVCVTDFNKQHLSKTLQSIQMVTGKFKEIVFYCSINFKIKTEKNIKKMDFVLETYSIVSDLEVELDAGTLASPCFIIHSGDQLHKDCITVLNNNIEQGNQYAYVDCDFIDENFKRYSPEFFPDWNPDLQLSTGYIQTGLWCCELYQVAFLHLEGKNFSVISQWLSTQYLSGLTHTVQHIPFVLVHKTASGLGMYKQIDREYLTKLDEVADIQLSKKDQVISLNWKLNTLPLVSLVIPTKNAKSLVKACIDSILQKTTYSNYEILLIDNNSDDASSLAYFAELSEHPQITVLPYPFEFNYSAINNFAVKHAKGEVVGLINNDIEVIEPDWLSIMVGHVMRPDIGCVGAKLLYPDKRIQHAGVVMGYGGGAGHAHKYFSSEHPGYLNRLVATQNFSAVTAACLLVHKEDYCAVGGLNETDLKVAFNDVDFCLRVLQLGRRNLYCAEAVLYHHESISRGAEDTVAKQLRFNSEVDYMRQKWQLYIDHDPAYNHNLTLRYENFSIKCQSEIDVFDNI
jgi:GT2 family glycosyltransferase